MAIIKCKMCGGDLVLEQGQTVAECEYCGSKQTVPVADDEKKLKLFDRAGRLLRNCEFDKAAGVFESIVAENPQEAEAYWGLLLCRYGIEYVDDPATGKKIPTCHRSSFTGILDDKDFELVMENADAVARRVYREEAKTIEELRKRIIEVSGKEEPYDIFICYKETDENGQRTLDSVLAQDLYDTLTDNGYRVFFARITLEDKLGQEYEPYIFAALHSAKIMLVVGTDYEYYNAVWVKNEWSRFLQMITAGEKKTLIPCYKNIDAYDMPKEFAKLQAQDLGKVGAIQDLLRGIEKILPKGQSSFQKIEVVQKVAAPGVESLLDRAFLFLEDGNWNKTKEYCEKVLDIDPKCAKAYLGKLLADRRIHRISELEDLSDTFDKNENYKKIIRFGNRELIEELQTYNKKVEYKSIYEQANGWLKEAENSEDIQKVKELFKQISDYKDVGEELAECERKIKEFEKNSLQNSNRLQAIRERLKPAQDMVLSGGSGHVVALALDGKVLSDKSLLGMEFLKWRNTIAIAESYHHTVGLKADGTVVAAGYNDDGQCNVSQWRDIIAVAASFDHTVGLKKDGTVVATGRNDFGQCDVSQWRNITAIVVGSLLTYGLKEDGTVVAAGYNEKGQCNVSQWRDISAITVGSYSTYGLKMDGTVVVVGEEKHEVSQWHDIVSVAAGYKRVVGLKSDGTIIECGERYSANEWYDIVAVSIEGDCTVGVRADGTVITSGFSRSVRGFEKWTDIVAVTLCKQSTRLNGDIYAVGLKADGRVVSSLFGALRETSKATFDVSGWRLFANIATLKDDRKKAAWRGAGRCQNCGGELKGFIAKRCVDCGKSKDY